KNYSDDEDVEVKPMTELEQKMAEKILQETKETYRKRVVQLEQERTSSNSGVENLQSFSSIRRKQQEHLPRNVAYLDFEVPLEMADQLLARRRASRVYYEENNKSHDERTQAAVVAASQVENDTSTGRPANFVDAPSSSSGITQPPQQQGGNPPTLLQDEEDRDIVNAGQPQEEHLPLAVTASSPPRPAAQKPSQHSNSPRRKMKASSPQKPQILSALGRDPNENQTKNNLVFGERYDSSRNAGGRNINSKMTARPTVFPDVLKRQKRKLSEGTVLENAKIDNLLRPLRTQLDRVADIYDPPEYDTSEE
ncbi:unnamed protein product, partial [Amoebophrya sp. A120]